MFGNLYLHNWRCPICLEGTEESFDEIVTLNTCGHKVHRQCIDQFLNQGTSAARLCPLCRQAHELRRNIGALIEQLISPIVYCDPSTLEGVSAELVVCWQQQTHNFFQLMRSAVDFLSADQLPQLYDIFRMLYSPTQSQLPQKLGVCYIQLGMQVANGASITKQMIRELFTEPLLEEFNQKELKAERDKQSILLMELLCKLLRDQGRDALAEQLMSTHRDYVEFEQANTAEIRKFSLESMINCIFEQFSQSFQESAHQGFFDNARNFTNEINTARGSSQEDASSIQ